MNFVRGFGTKLDGYPYINLDHVSLLRPIREDGRLVAYDCEDERGDTIGRISSYEGFAGESVVPEVNGTVLLQFFRLEGSLEVHRYPVIAWAIDTRSVEDSDGLGGAKPIICDDLSEPWCLELRTGIFVFPYDRTCMTLEEVMTAAEEKLNAEEALQEAKRAAKKRAAKNGPGD